MLMYEMTWEDDLWFSADLSGRINLLKDNEFNPRFLVGCATEPTSLLPRPANEYAIDLDSDSAVILQSFAMAEALNRTTCLLSFVHPEWPTQEIKIEGFAVPDWIAELEPTGDGTAIMKDGKLSGHITGLVQITDTEMRTRRSGIWTINLHRVTSVLTETVIFKWENPRPSDFAISDIGNSHGLY